jgi:hypothetical protein
LFKIPIQGVSLWHCHVYIYTNIHIITWMDSSPLFFFFLL